MNIPNEYITRTEEIADQVCFVEYYLVSYEISLADVNKAQSSNRIMANVAIFKTMKVKTIVWISVKED